MTPIEDEYRHRLEQTLFALVSRDQMREMSLEWNHDIDCGYFLLADSRGDRVVTREHGMNVFLDFDAADDSCLVGVEVLSKPAAVAVLCVLLSIP